MRREKQKERPMSKVLSLIMIVCVIAFAISPIIYAGAVLA